MHTLLMHGRAGMGHDMQGKICVREKKWDKKGDYRENEQHHGYCLSPSAGEVGTVRQRPL